MRQPRRRRRGLQPLLGAALASGLALLGAGMVTLGASPASAHVPAISADCDGVRLHATSYDAGKTNTWSVTIGGKTESGTFGTSVDTTFPVPQGGATTTWSASIDGGDGTAYDLVEGGTVGPCGTPYDECADLPGDQPKGTRCDRPKDEVSVERSEGEPDCDSDTVTITTTTTRTKYTFDSASNTWKKGTPQVSTSTDTRPVTAQECPPPDKPEPVVERSRDRDVDCTADVAIVTTTVTTTDWVLRDDTWVKDTPVTTTSKKRVDVKDQECPTTKPPTHNEQPPTPVTSPPPPVPTVIDAGLAAAPADAGGHGGALPWSLTLLGGGGLLAAAVLTARTVGRRRGARQL
ncbi:MAG TPA: hypothetical protein VFG88_02300 [Nocardioidaceae bacterium]|nr:hypothetical protein [Nocardioidaceae bacterium]